MSRTISAGQDGSLANGCVCLPLVNSPLDCVGSMLRICCDRLGMLIRTWWLLGDCDG